MMGKLPVRRSTAGFTLTELLIVIVMIGILMAIAAPSWVAFINSRRADAAREQILQALRQAQAQALRTRQFQTVQFADRTATSPPTVTVFGDTQKLGSSQGKDQFTPNMVSLQVLTYGANKADDCPNTNCIEFDAKGNILNQMNAPGIKVVVYSPPAPATTATRCVFIQTILGATQLKSGTDCN